jgi:copper chaperone
MYEFHLPDMSCGHCVATVTQTIQALDAQAQLEFDREARRVKVQSSLPQETLAAALSEEGYPPAA